MNTNHLSRRDFLKWSAAASAGLILVSCSGLGSGGTRILVDSWALAYAPFKEMAKKYNELHPQAHINVEASPGGWMTKVVGQIRSNKLQWNAAGVMAPFLDLASWVQLGLIQPLDDYLAASTEEGASAFRSDMLPSIKADESLDGKMYGIPFGVENITYQWNSEWFGKAGISQAPRTWQELVDNSKTMQGYLAAQGKKDTYALGFDLGHLNRNLGAIFFSITDQPYTQDGWLNWETDDMRQALRFMRQASRDGLTPPNCGEGVDMYDLWKRGRLVGLYSCSSRGLWAQKTLGFDKITTSQIPTVDGKPHSGAAFWSNSISILNKAPLPQQVIDFLIYACGPQNSDWQKAIIQAGNAPAFDSVYTGLLAGDATLQPFKWMNELRDQLVISTPAPKNYYYQIQNEAWTRHWPEYLKDSSTMTEDQLIQKVLASSQEILKTVLESIPTLTP
jgi:ABC-type glycerol-3-phosphate transport system substrate-binding protein